MKLILAHIRPHKLDEVALALRQLPGLTGVSASTSRGWGHAKQEAEKEHRADRVSDFEEYIRLEICCVDSLAEDVIDAIELSARTGLLGDGKIFVSALEETIRIRTGDRGEGAC
jgi:nitrogen regulatory protein PII